MLVGLLATTGTVTVRGGSGVLRLPLITVVHVVVDVYVERFSYEKLALFLSLNLRYTFRHHLNAIDALYRQSIHQSLRQI